MEYNEKFKKVEGFDDVYFYKGNLYKKVFIHAALDGYSICNFCDLVSICRGIGLDMQMPESCIKDSYFKKITTLPTQCNTCEHYKPKFEDHLPNTIEDVKKIICVVLKTKCKKAFL